MNIAIIGGGLTGLTAAYELTKKGHQVSVFEKSQILGGLAHGFKEKNWLWPLEFAYHHFFTNDKSLIDLLHELDMGDNIIIKRPITATYISNSINNTARGNNFRISHPELSTKTNNNNNNQRVAEQENYFTLRSFQNEKNIFQLDSPLSLLQFNQIPIIDRLRTGAMLAFMKLNPFWQPLEGITAEKFVRTLGGEKTWNLIWEPLMRGKFTDLDTTVAASWFWARIKKRTTNLGYIRGGFQALINRLERHIKTQGGQIYPMSQISQIIPRQRGLYDLKIETDRTGKQKYDNESPRSSSGPVLQQFFNKILLTTPTPIAVKLMSKLTSNNVTPRLSLDSARDRRSGQTMKQFNNMLSIPHLHAQLLILETDKPILDKIYWLNISDETFPFLALVQHTNFIDSKYYGGRHITYIGNYLPEGHPYLTKSADQLLSLFKPYIQRLSPNSKFKILNYKLFIGPYAQPVHQLHYSQKAPQLETGIPNIYLANMDSIYPWDRGTNYAVELGQKTASRIQSLALI
ncbi:hypothetical protein A2154_04440 [Candidatus Gottesmanbacteria bacterium RBG_16_43_7]|uniref:Amine oxidase domain-containing protein n=1 Tax=Candidatus Gottesmanbacteria bacterium RBG_16_43_7 TaxID=1798373 RepID=A0A1F5ZD43_9BACT|nr:MAG: hypothetical protein A2154_04440 [Candidatus Gottesmanbacteria bacterium RBG_16_43_7]